MSPDMYSPHFWHGDEGLMGHSFRVRRASVHAALGIPMVKICQLERWKSSCYKLYLREYSDKDKEAVISTLFNIGLMWQDRIKLGQ